MSNKPKPVEKDAYLLSRVRLLEDRTVMLEGNLGRMGDYLGYVGEQLQEVLGVLEELKPKNPIEQPPVAEPVAIAPPADEQTTLQLVP